MARISARRAKRTAALEAVCHVFDATSRLTKAQRAALARTIALFQANDRRGMVAVYKALPVDGQADFWRSLALVQASELEERFPAETHAAFWCAVAQSQARQLEQLRAGNANDDPGSVIELFPRGES